TGTGGTDGTGGGNGTGKSSGGKGGRTDTTGGNNGGTNNTGAPDDTDEEGEVIEGAEPDPNAKPSNYRPPYREPVVKLDKLEAWSYAVGGSLKITDRSGAIQRGIKIAVYRELTKTRASASPTTNEAGQKVYPSSGYEGKSAMTRRTFLGNQDLALSPLQPETTLYIQLSYRYNEEKTVDENGKPYTNDKGEPVTMITRKTHYSDLVELKTLSVKDHVEPVSISWAVVYAAADRAMRLDNLALKNTADYRDNLESFDFGNFKRNTLPYISRLVYTLTDEAGNTENLTVGSTVVSKARQQSGVGFTSSAQLRSNTRYTMTVKAYDRYGNEMPLRVDNKTPQNVVYTSKTAPTAIIEETENITDKLSIRITVSDPDDALVKGEDGNALPLFLTVLDSGRNNAVVGGRYKDGTEFGKNNERELELLPVPVNRGGSYELTLDSLAFGQAYTLNVLGDYNLQPDYETDTPLQPLSHAVVGSLRTYTAALGTGTIAFSTSIPSGETLDTSAVIYATMNSRTTTSILPMIDEFRVIVTNAATKERVGETLVLDMETLDDTDWHDYTEADGEVTVTVRQAAANSAGVTLSGAANQWARADHSPWQAMLISSSVNETTGEVTYNTPMTLRIALPEKTLDSSTKYEVSIDSVVIKSGIEYHIPTTLTVSQFTSKKIQPQVKYDDLFIAGDMLQFINMYIYDPDGTILKDGTVTATLWYGADDPNGTRLAVIPLKASRLKHDEEGFVGYQTLRFDALNAGADYYLWFKADEFNDAEGYGSYAFNKELLHEHFTGGSRLSGELELTSLEFDSTAEQTNIWEDMTWSGPQIAEAIAGGTLTKDGSNDRYITPRMEIPTDADGKRATFLQLQGYFAVRGPYIRAEYYYSDSTSVSLYYGVYVSRGATPTFMVPPQAKYVRFRLSDRQTLEQTGVRTAFYTTPQEDLYTTSLQTVYYDMENVPTPSYLRSGAELDTSSGIGTSGTSYHYLHMLPVKKGEVYTIGWQYSQNREDDQYGRVYFWTADKAFKGTYRAYRFSSITIPDDVGYMSVGYSNWLQPSTTQIMRVCESGSVDAYTAKVSVTVTDSYGYLKEDPKVTMTLRQAQTLYVSEEENVDESLSDYATQNFELIRHENEDGSVYWSLDDEKLLAALPPNKRFAATLTATYQGATVTLDTMEFRTDGPYGIIRCNEDMWQIVRNPWGNFIVTQPFEHYLDIGDDNYSLVNVYGSLDFQGHKITRRAGWTPVRRFISTVQGVVRNLYYEYPAPLTNEETGEPVILNVNRTVIFSVGARGLVENFVVATKGAIRVNHQYGALMVYSCSGTVRNWILKLGGDVHVTRTDGYTDLGIVCYYRYGALEDGYVYT
ncbi:MAG: hypothetical protein IJV64_10195, partial [Oscillospiraceae bacterium]|nr:hypothetical protein [Oscillospiraceae bacterium]